MLFWILPSSLYVRLLTQTPLLEIKLPTYVYDCLECGHRFELKQSFQSDSTAPCPLCKTKSQRVILSVPVVFKGSGFYVNDYGKAKDTSKSTSESTKDKTSTDKPSNQDNSQSTNKDSKSNSDSATKKDVSSGKSDTKSNGK